jgi:hypothetical protein
VKAKTPPRDLEASLSELLLDDAWHREALEALREVAPFAWITGGFVRNAIWDVSFEKERLCTPADVDVVYLGPRRKLLLSEGALDAALNRAVPGIEWSVRNQSRMHRRSNDAPYRSLGQALEAFPDRSSAIAVRLLPSDELEILAPFGLEDAFRGVVRPTPAALADDRFPAFLNRKLDGWLRRWPWLSIVYEPVEGQSSSRRAA